MAGQVTDTAGDRRHPDARTQRQHRCERLARVVADTPATRHTASDQPTGVLPPPRLWGQSCGTAVRILLHQMRPWPPAWRRPVEDRPPYAVWVIGGLIVWAFLLAGFMVWDLHSTSRTTIWAIFAGWCIGVLGASIARKIYR